MAPDPHKRWTEGWGSVSWGFVDRFGPKSLGPVQRSVRGGRVDSASVAYREDYDGGRGERIEVSGTNSSGERFTFTLVATTHLLDVGESPPDSFVGMSKDDALAVSKDYDMPLGVGGLGECGMDCWGLP